MPTNMEGTEVIETITDSGEVGNDSQAEAGASSALDEETSSDELISITEASVHTDTDPGEANNTQAEEDDKKESKEESEDTGSQDEEDETRFDKHPRFQEIMGQRDTNLERALKAEAKLEVQSQAGQGEDDKDYQDLMEKTDAELREEFNEDPRKVFSNLGRQIRAEIIEEVKHETARESRDNSILKTFDTYAKANSTFDSMLQSGEIDRYITANPGNNAISAHQSLTAEKKTESTKTQQDEAVTKAVKETEERMIKQFKAKGHATVLGEGPSGAGKPQDTEDEISHILKNPNKYGGNVAATVKAMQVEAAAKARGG